MSDEVYDSHCRDTLDGDKNRNHGVTIGIF